MTISFLVPRLSATSEVMTVVAWLKKPGNAVKMGEPFVELETDKTVLEVEAPVTGTLSSIAAHEGDKVEVGVVLAEFQEAGVAVRPVAIAAGDTAVVIAPAVEQAAALPAATPRAPAAMRRGVARSVVRSRREIPSFWAERWIPTVSIHRAREAAREAGSEIPSITDYLLQAIGCVIAERSTFRTVWTGEDEDAAITIRPGSHVGLVVAVEDGMLVPVVKDCGTASLAEIRRQRVELTEAARQGRITNSTNAATVTLSNLGAAGADRFEAIALPEQTAIVAVGRELARPDIEDGEVRVCRGVNVVVSVDHRVVDGREAALFLAALVERVKMFAS